MTRRPLSVPFVEPLEARRLLAATTLRINVGGGEHVEASGKSWQADRGYTAGTAVSSVYNVAGTNEDALFATHRRGNFAYSLRIQNGTYRVKLLLADPAFSGAGQRVFNVVAERKPMLTNFDVAGAAGGKTAAVKTSTVTVKDGRLNLWFQNVTDEAMVSAIEVTPAAAPAIQWKTLADAPQNKFEQMGAVVDDKLYVFGGYFSRTIKATSQVAVYDPATDTWATRKDMPETLTHSGTAIDFRSVYLAGGYVGDWQGQSTPVSRSVWRYDTANDTWERMQPLPAGRSAGALVRVGRKLHFFGGLDRDKRDRADHWTLDLRRPTRWMQAPAMPNARNHLGYAELGGKIYAIGGQHDLDEHHANERAVHAFDVVAGTWSAVASLPRPLSHNHNSTLLSGGKILVVGGSSNGPVSVQEILQYDPSTNRWSTLGLLPAPLSAAVAQLINGHVIVTGGQTDDAVPKDHTFINV